MFKLVEPKCNIQCGKSDILLAYIIQNDLRNVKIIVEKNRIKFLFDNFKDVQLFILRCFRDDTI